MLTNVVCVSLLGYHLNSQTDITKYSSVSVKTEIIYARRGYIFDRNGNVIAEDSISYNMYAILDTSRPGYGDIPAYVPEENKAEYATKIATILGVDSTIVLGYLQQSGVYQTEFGNYGRNLDKATKEIILQAKKILPNIARATITTRFKKLSNKTIATFFDMESISPGNLLKCKNKDHLLNQSIGVQLSAFRLIRDKNNMPIAKLNAILNSWLINLSTQNNYNHN